MRDPINHLKDLKLERCTPRPDLSEVATASFHSDVPDGFSMEWMLDRFGVLLGKDGRQS